MSKYKEYAVVCSQEQIAADIYSLWIQTEEIARAAGPGQFLSSTPCCRPGSNGC